MVWIVFILIGIIVFLILMKPLAEKETKRQKYITEKIKSIYAEYNFLPKKDYLSAGNNSLIAYDQDDRFCFMNIENALDTNINNHSYEYSFINSEDILEVDLYKDSKSIIKTSKKGLIGGAVVGGLVAGNIGSLIGSLAADKNQNDEIKELSLKITVNNKDNPIHTIEIFNHRKGLQGEKYTKQGIDEIEFWFNLIKVIIHENDGKQNMVNF